MAILTHTEDPDRPYYIEVHSPWDERDYPAINYPEHFATSQGMIMHHRADIKTPYRQTRPVQWHVADDGSEASYTCEFENGLEFSVRLTAKGNEVVQVIRMRNGSDKPVARMCPTLCTLLSSWREFQNDDDKMAHLDRTYTLVDGRLVTMAEVWASYSNAKKAPGEGRVWVGCNVRGQKYANEQWYIWDQECDAGFIAVRSKERERYVALHWPKCRLVFTNTNVPCIHADPELAGCAPGEEASLTGRIVFHDADLRSLVESVGR